MRLREVHGIQLFDTAEGYGGGTSEAGPAGGARRAARGSWGGVVFCLVAKGPGPKCDGHLGSVLQTPSFRDFFLFLFLRVLGCEIHSRCPCHDVGPLLQLGLKGNPEENHLFSWVSARILLVRCYLCTKSSMYSIFVPFQVTCIRNLAGGPCGIETFGKQQLTQTGCWAIRSSC